MLCLALADSTTPAADPAAPMKALSGLAVVDAPCAIAPARLVSSRAAEKKELGGIV